MGAVRVVRWTGRETRALRLAHRMTVRAFAARIGLSDRMISKREKGGPGIVSATMHDDDTGFRCTIAADKLPPAQ